MQLTKRGIVFIVLLVACALLMTLEFGGNYDTFYAWLSGEAHFTRYGSPQETLCTALAWIYLVTLVGTVAFELFAKSELMMLCSYVSGGAMLVMFLFGLFWSNSWGALCIGMPLLLAVSIAYIILGKKWVPEEL